MRPNATPPSAGKARVAAWCLDLPRQGLIALVRAYRLVLSPWLGSSCRFTPSCSAYALDALRHHGAGMGSYLTLRRLVRCHPWCEGGHDPVPASRSRLFPPHQHTPPT